MLCGGRDSGGQNQNKRGRGRRVERAEGAFCAVYRTSQPWMPSDKDAFRTEAGRNSPQPTYTSRSMKDPTLVSLFGLDYGPYLQWGVETSVLYHFNMTGSSLRDEQTVYVHDIYLYS